MHNNEEEEAVILAATTTSAPATHEHEPDAEDVNAGANEENDVATEKQNLKEKEEEEENATATEIPEEDSTTAMEVAETEAVPEAPAIEEQPEPATEATSTTPTPPPSMEPQESSNSNIEETETIEKDEDNDKVQDENLELENSAVEAASNEENTILLPAPDKQLVENILTSNLGEDGTDEQAIAIKTENESNLVQEDVLAEPLGEEDNLYAANINVKPIEGVLVKVEAITDEISRSSGRKRTTRKSAAAAAAAIRVKSEHSPDSDTDAPRTTRSKKYLKTIALNDGFSRKKIKPIKLKSEIESEDDNSLIDNSIEIDAKQCRICLSKDSLLSLFKKDQNSYTIADKIMSICYAIKITQKDNLPQYVCSTCVQSVNVAYNLKVLCEKTDKELRSKLRRKKIKKERTILKKEQTHDDGGGDESVEESNNKDDDFVISNESAPSAVESDSDTDFGSKRKRSLRKKKTSGLKKRGKSGGGGSSHKRSRPNKEKLENGKVDDNNGSTDDGNLGPSKRKRAKLKSTKTDDDDEKKKDKESKDSKEYICLYCEEKFPSMNTLREHKKIHVGQKPFTCNICNKPFKMVGSYNAHIQKHKEEENLICSQCGNKQFTNKTEFKKHMSEVHNEPPTSFACDKCKKVFTSQSRLDKHKDGKCPGHEVPQSGKKDKKRSAELDAIAVGRDLFKCVAPMTTTYWSDSFSD